jgi:hypothetical protein
MARFNTKTEVTETQVTAPVEQVTAPTTIVAPATTPGITLSETQQSAFNVMTTKSERIRFLSSLGHKNGPISKYLSTVYGKLVRYQHVRNVLKSPLKKG